MRCGKPIYPRDLNEPMLKEWEKSTVSLAKNGIKIAKKILAKHKKGLDVNIGEYYEIEDLEENNG